jgi:hypothetical protein
MEKELTIELYDRMVGGIYPDNIEGTCQIQLVGEQDIFSTNISCVNNELSYSEVAKKEPDAVIAMKPETLSEILSNPQLDLRDGDILKQVEVKGDLGLIGFLFSLVKRPSPEIWHLLEETEKNAAIDGDKISEVKRVNKPSRSEVIHLINNSEPFVITGAIDDWEFLSKSLSELKAEYGEVKLRPNLKEGKGKYETLREFIEKMENASTDSVYTGGCGLPLAMWAKFQWPFFDWDALIEPQMWLGNKTGDKPCTELHRDCINGMLANIFGRKKLVLFSPNQSNFLYPIRAFNSYQKCQVKDVKNVNLDKFPLFKNANPVEVTIGPAELLVIPAFWYHCVYALDNVFSISAGIQWKSWKAVKPV